MGSGIAELVEALREKGCSLECLQAILEEENELIARLDSEGLSINSSKKLQVFERISNLNEKCRAALENAYREVGIPGKSTLSPLLPGLKQPEREIVQTLQKTVIRTAQKTEQLLKMNKDLLENSLKFIESSMNFFKRFFNKSDTYGNSGRMLATPPAPRIVCKEM